MKIRWANIATFLGSHAAASIVYVLLFIAVPMGLAAAGIGILLVLAFISGDPGGPLFFPMLAIFCLLYCLAAAVGGVILFFACSGIQAMKKKVKYSWWIPLIVVPPLAFALPTVFEAGNPMFWMFLVTMPFVAYWLSLNSTEAIIGWIRRRVVGSQKNSQPSDPLDVAKPPLSGSQTQDT